MVKRPEGKRPNSSADDVKHLERFVAKIISARDTPAIIRIIAGDGMLLDDCRKLIASSPDSASTLWRQFAAVCKKSGVDPSALRERLVPAARSLGLGMHEEIQLNYYDLLGVSPNAGIEEIQRAYHQKAKSLHPDTRTEGSDDGGDEAFIRLAQGYRVLKDPILRRHYDQSRRSIETWCEYPACDFNKKGAKRSSRSKWFVLKLGAVIAVLICITMIFSAVYEKRAAREGLYESLSSENTSNTRKPIQQAIEVESSGVNESSKDKNVPMVMATRPGNRNLIAPLKTKGSKADSAYLGDTPSRAERIVPEGAETEGIWDTPSRAERIYRQDQNGEQVEEPRVGVSKHSVEADQTPKPKEAEHKIVKSDTRVEANQAGAGDGSSRKKEDEALAMLQSLADRDRVIQDVKTFIRTYSRLYEEKNLSAFLAMFTEDAQENGKNVSNMVSDYRQLFQNVEKLEYQVDLFRFSFLPDRGLVRAEGNYRIAWRVSGRTRQEGKGNVAFELIRRDGAYRVKKLNYSEIRAQEP